MSEMAPKNPSAWAIGRGAWLVIGIVFVLRLLFVLLVDLEVLGDEAHYWEWSRYPRLSYYTKGPGVAWCIGAGTSLFGPTVLGIRLPSLLLGALTLWGCALLARRLFGSERAALHAALLAALYPGFQVMGLVMTIDGPLLASWALALLVGWRIHSDPDAGTRPWVALGLILGLGFLAKYTSLLYLPGFLLSLPRRRVLARGPLLGLLTMVAVTSPVWIWNTLRGWPTVKHLLGHLKVAGGDRAAKPWEPWNTFPEFAGVQAAMLGPLLLLVFAAWRWSRGRGPVRTYLLACSLPTLLFYAAVALKARVQPNWALPAYMGLLILAAGMLAEAAPPRTKRLRGLLIASVAFGSLLMPLGVFGAMNQDHPTWSKRAPLRRFTGARARADRVERARLWLRERTGKEPILIARRYDTAGLLAFYLPDQPKLYSANRYFGGRQSAYDDIPATNLEDPALIGRPAILVDSHLERWQRALRLEGAAWREEWSVICVERYLGTVERWR